MNHRILLSAALAMLAAAPALAQESAPSPAATPTTQPEPPKPKPVAVPEGPALVRKELEGGLVTEDLVVGEGYEVKPGGAVIVYYHGTLRDGGKVFDSSFDRGETIAFALEQVIPGWQKGVPGMKVGGVRRLIVPAAMAYGDRGNGPDIPPNSDLIFVIKLVDALQIEDIKVGEGEQAAVPCLPVTAHVVKDKDGKEVERVDATKMWVWVPGECMGMNMGVIGMKVGGKRRLIIPKEFNPDGPPMYQVTRPKGERLEIEFELLAVRNFGGPGKPH